MVPSSAARASMPEVSPPSSNQQNKINMIPIRIGFLLTVHVIVCILLILIVLMQRPKGEGLGTTFGGGGTDTLFGSGAGNVLTKNTTWLGTIFFITTVVLAYLYSHREQSDSLGSKMKAAPVI